MMTEIETQLQYIEPGQRVLLLPHCLRRADSCQGKYSQQGLECHECNPDCPVNKLSQAARRLGYKGVCVAPGGRLALKYIEQSKPLGIVAVACDKELQEGIRGVSELTHGTHRSVPVVVIPLSKDGCVDTEVDVELALAKISMGCALPARSRS